MVDFNYGIQMENCVRLRNSRTLATVGLSNEAYASLSSNSDKSGSVKDIAGQLARLGLWVESRDDECKKYWANLKNDVEGLTGDASLIVAVTRQCNLACKYCYENGSCREGTYGKLDIENPKYAMVVWFETARKEKEPGMHHGGGRAALASREIIKRIINLGR